MASVSAATSLAALVPEHASAGWLTRLLLSSHAIQLVQHLKLMLKPQLKLELDVDLRRSGHVFQKCCGRVDGGCAT